MLETAKNDRLAAGKQPGDAIAETWQEVLKRAIRDPAELCRVLGLPESLSAEALRGTGDFPLLVPRGYVTRMRHGDRHDPLLRQVLPSISENEAVAGFSADPVGDFPAQRQPGLLHKYSGRALLVTTGACAVHCRYCFRRHFPYQDAPHGIDQWEPAFAEIEADRSLDEVILSGGDPLTLVDGQLELLVERLAAIPHLKRLRVHTRLPVLIPQRVNDRLLAWLRGNRLTPIVVIHANHAAEIDRDVAAAIARMVDAGVPVLNQAVLLRGVNDSVESLEKLCRALIDLRVLPYYLHQLDRVAGAAHFEVSREQGRQLIAELQRRLPGYAVPRYVQEIPGADSKSSMELG